MFNCKICVEIQVGMAAASKDSEVPMTTASFIEHLNRQNSSSSTPSKVDSSSLMESLSDSDLQTLLQNFKDLSTDEQQGLITYLKKLEAKEPERVEKLRKFVNLGSNKTEDGKRPGSPFVNRMGGVNPSVEEDIFSDEESQKDVKEEEEVKRIKIDSDEEDYTIEDVFEAADKNVKEKKLEQERKLVEETIKQSNQIKTLDLADAQALIQNLVSSIGNSNRSAGTDSQNDTEKESVESETVKSNFINIIENVDVTDLTSIVKNIQHLPRKNIPITLIGTQNKADTGCTVSNSQGQQETSHVQNTPPSTQEMNTYLNDKEYYDEISPLPVKFSPIFDDEPPRTPQFKNNDRPNFNQNPVNVKGPGVNSGAPCTSQNYNIPRPSNFRPQLVQYPIRDVYGRYHNSLYGKQEFFNRGGFNPNLREIGPVRPRLPFNNSRGGFDQPPGYGRDGRW